MSIEEFYKKEDPENNADYDSDMDYWYFSREELKLFAKRYAKAKLEEASEKLPNFIYKNPYGLLIVGVPGDSSVEYEWGEFKKSITNTPLD